MCANKRSRRQTCGNIFRVWLWCVFFIIIQTKIFCTIWFSSVYGIYFGSFGWNIDFSIGKRFLLWQFVDFSQFQWVFRSYKKCFRLCFGTKVELSLHPPDTEAAAELFFWGPRVVNAAVVAIHAIVVVRSSVGVMTTAHCRSRAPQWINKWCIVWRYYLIEKIDVAEIGERVFCF